mmetsp:Transcript_64282/g.150987  ORF Transcript_64282/g.150987 Transcript_64282/m.150987 type:complete len:235 (-) Transcript_64282:118-822(-)
MAICLDCCCAPSRTHACGLSDEPLQPQETLPSEAPGKRGQPSQDTRCYLLELVRAFVRQSSAGGQDCHAARLPAGPVHAAQYLLKDGASILEVKAKQCANREQEVLCTWRVASLCVQNAETAKVALEAASSKSLDLPSSACLSSGETQWLLTCGCSEARDQFVLAMQILQLYQMLAQRYHGFSTPKKGELVEAALLGGSLRPPTCSPATPQVSPFARKAPAPPPTPEKTDAGCL